MICARARSPDDRRPRSHPELSTRHRRPDRRRDASASCERQPRSREMSERAHTPRRRRHLQLAGGRAARRLDQPRRRLQGVRRRRQRVLRLPRRVRRRRSPATPTRRSSRRSAAGVGRGTHFAQPTEDSIVVADNLAERFGQPLWRFGNSGTESTMDAVHLMRAATGRDRILKVEGCYHGHHDSVMVSVLPEADDDIGPDDAPDRHPGQHRDPGRDHRPDHDRAVQRPRRGRGARSTRYPGEIAGMILEPIMMNAGIIHPRGRLPRRAQGPAPRARRAADLRRGEDRPHRRPRRRLAAARRDPRPGLRRQGDGRRALDRRDRRQREVMELIADGDYEQVGTFNGNPLAMAAARAMLTEVLDRRRRTPTSTACATGCATGSQAVIDRHDAAVARGDGRRQGLRVLPARPDPQLPRLPRARRPLRPRPLAGPAQPRRVPAAVGQGRAVADLGAAHRRRTSTASSPTSTTWPTRVLGAPA